jgi:regulator of CtrA degradation
MDGAKVTYFHRIYDETMSLLLEARDYLAAREHLGFGRAQPGYQLVVSCETMRVTARLTQAMAWLLFQKAIHAGEISQREARKEACRLGGHRACLDHHQWGEVELPYRLQGLLDRSQSLYQRVARLDDLAGSRRAGARPARDLRGRWVGKPSSHDSGRPN